jgi:hypothetical protein
VCVGLPDLLTGWWRGGCLGCFLRGRCVFQYLHSQIVCGRVGRGGEEPFSKSPMLRAWILVFKVVSCILVCPVGHSGLVDSKKPLLELVDGPHSLEVVGVSIHKLLIWH